MPFFGFEESGFHRLRLECLLDDGVRRLRESGIHIAARERRSFQKIRGHMDVSGSVHLRRVRIERGKGIGNGQEALRNTR